MEFSFQVPNICSSKDTENCKFVLNFYKDKNMWKFRTEKNKSIYVSKFTLLPGNNINSVESFIKNAEKIYYEYNPVPDTIYLSITNKMYSEDMFYFYLEGPKNNSYIGDEEKIFFTEIRRSPVPNQTLKKRIFQISITPNAFPYILFHKGNYGDWLEKMETNFVDILFNQILRPIVENNITQATMNILYYSNFKPKNWLFNILLHNPWLRCIFFNTENLEKIMNILIGFVHIKSMEKRIGAGAVDEKFILIVRPRIPKEDLNYHVSLTSEPNNVPPEVKSTQILYKSFGNNISLILDI